MDIFLKTENGLQWKESPRPRQYSNRNKKLYLPLLGWGKKWSHGHVREQRNTPRRRLTVDRGPWTVDPGTATEPPPHTFHSPGAASLWIGSSSLRGGKPNLTREVSIHTNSRLTAMVVSKLIRRFDAERRVHLLLIRPDRFFTSASSVHTFSPFRRRSASERHGLGCISVPTTGRGWSGRRGTF